MQPQTPPSSRQSDLPPSSEASQHNPLLPAQAPRKRPYALIVSIILLAVLVAVASALYAIKKPAKNNLTPAAKTSTAASASQATVKQIVVDPATKQEVPLRSDEYYSVTTTAGKQVFYGHIRRISDAFVRVAPTIYSNNGVLVAAGQELQGPEPETYIAVANITNLKKLDAANADDKRVLDAIQLQTASAAQPKPATSTDIDTYLNQNEYHAFFFNDGSAFFARAKTLSGNFLASSGDVFALNSTWGNSPSGPTGGTQQISLAVAKAVQYSGRTSAQLIYWQNMRSDSKISRAINNYEQNKVHVQNSPD